MSRVISEEYIPHDIEAIDLSLISTGIEPNEIRLESIRIMGTVLNILDQPYLLEPYLKIDSTSYPPKVETVTPFPKIKEGVLLIRLKFLETAADLFGTEILSLASKINWFNQLHINFLIDLMLPKVPQIEVDRIN